MNLNDALDNARADRALGLNVFPRGLVLPAPARTIFQAKWDRLERMPAHASARPSSLEDCNHENDETLGDDA